jgi:hypothetical protein
MPGILVAAVAAITSIVVFYRGHDFPSDRLEGIGLQTNINHFSNVYGVLALLAMGFALRTQALAPGPRENRNPQIPAG